MIHTIRRGLSITAFVLAAAWPLAGSGAVINGLVIFGDSLNDTGNNAFFFDTVIGPPQPPGTLRTPTPIPSPVFIPVFPYVSDRYSNGPVWVEPFAASLEAHSGVDLTADARAALLGGSNFAFGGARMGPPGSSFPFSVRDQVASYLSATGGVAPSDTLFIVQGGGNDARDAFAVAATGGNPSALIADYAANTVAILTQLHAAGAENFLFVNVPNIGFTPAVRALGPNAMALAAGIAAAMNTSLDAMLSALSADLLDGLSELDLFDLLNEVVLNPGAFGFTDVTSACAFDPSCIADPSTTFFWDGIHPTAAGHALLARVAFATVVPEPPIVLLIIAGLGLLGVAQRRHATTRRSLHALRIAALQDRKSARPTEGPRHTCRKEEQRTS